MKKIIRLVLSIGLITLIVGCGNATVTKEDSSSSKTKDVTVTVILKENHKEFDQKKIEVAEKTDLQTAMEKNFDVVTDKGFIKSIEGKEQDNAEQNTKGSYWMYDINGAPATVGASDTKLKDGDEIVWDLSGQ
ncbi:DUF4430 domain-containing protein [Carnobacterium maltaromaticum]|uniref:DUF4430 domain-containing protein n=1 Tax=Carnobacterium maltaromaticum TaxID=2751 RepID=UPI00191BC464|nr:DUF4430 domain-containing protein [Carnobacterium maltaromaticum]CAD5902863.1 conserved exported hypothetical protein [Carnobacterium maltaromaticum]